MENTQNRPPEEILANFSASQHTRFNDAYADIKYQEGLVARARVNKPAEKIRLSDSERSYADLFGITPDEFRSLVRFFDTLSNEHGMSPAEFLSSTNSLDTPSDDQRQIYPEAEAGTEVSISLYELGELTNARGDVTFGRIEVTPNEFAEPASWYYDLYNESGNLACCDGETAKIISAEGNIITLHSYDAEDGVNFKLTREEFEKCALYIPQEKEHIKSARKDIERD